MTDSKATPCELVREFHNKYGFPVDQRLAEQGLGSKVVTSEGHKINVSQLLMSTSIAFAKAAQGMLTVGVPMQKEGDERAYRAHLMIEELSEVLQALAERDEVALADGLTDLSYVVNGTLVTYGLPGEALFCEVHRSNMTKSRAADDPRMKAKDPARGYETPDIKGVINDRR